MVKVTEWNVRNVNEPPHDKTNKMACAPSEGSDQPGHPPSLIRVFAVRMKKARILSFLLSAQRRLWSDWADAQTDLFSLGAKTFCWFCHEVDQIQIRGVFLGTRFCSLCSATWKGLPKPRVHRCSIFQLLKIQISQCSGVSLRRNHKNSRSLLIRVFCDAYLKFEQTASADC